MASSFGGTIKLTGESEYKSAIKQIVQELKTLSSEENLLASQCTNTGTTMDDLKRKSELLTDKFNKQQEGIAYLRAELEKSKDEFGENSNKTMQWQEQLNKAEIELNGLTGEIKDNENNMSKLSEANKIGISTLEDVQDQTKKTDDGFTVWKGTLADLASNVIQNVVSKLKEFVTESVEVTAELSEQNAAYTQVMGNNVDYANNKLEELSTKTGAVKSRLKNDFTTITAGWTGLGYSVQDGTDMATREMSTAADFAAMYGLTVEDCTNRIQSFMNGNMNAAEAIGISTNATNIAAWATDNLNVNYDNLSEAEKKVVRLQFAENMANLSGITGQASREAGNYANVTGNLSATWKEFQATVMQPILENVVIPALTKLKDIIAWSKDNLPVVTAIIVGLIATIVAFNWANIIGWVGNMIKGVLALNSAMLANPIGLVVAAVAALTVAFVYLWNNCEGFRTFFINLWNAIKAKASDVATAIKDTVGGAVDFIKNLPSQALTWGKDMIDNLIKGIKSKINAVGDAVKGVANKIKSFLGFSEPEEGPLSNFHTYMPDMIDLMAQGISGGKGQIKNAVNGIAGEISDSINTSDFTTKNTSFGVNSNSDMVSAFKEALGQMHVTLDDEKVGSFVENTITQIVYS